MWGWVGLGGVEQAPALGAQRAGAGCCCLQAAAAAPLAGLRPGAWAHLTGPHRPAFTQYQKGTLPVLPGLVHVRPAAAAAPAAQPLPAAARAAGAAGAGAGAGCG